MRAQCTFKEQSQNIARRKISLNDHTICSYSKYKIPLEVPTLHSLGHGNGRVRRGCVLHVFFTIDKKKKKIQTSTRASFSLSIGALRKPESCT